MKRLTYFCRLLIYGLITIIFHLATMGARVPGIQKVSKSFVATYAVGNSTQAIQEKRYVQAFKVLSIVEDYDLEDGHVAAAQYNLGYLYYYGYGVQRDTERAFALFEKSAKKGNKIAIKVVNGGASNDPIFPRSI